MSVLTAILLTIGVIVFTWMVMSIAISASGGKLRRGSSGAMRWRWKR